MYNKKVLNQATANLDKAKAPPKKQDIIVDPMGQWKYPGQNTRIPGGDITMQGVPYPVWAQPNVGPGILMQPEQDYQFPGADYVDEYPIAKKGGALPKLPKKKNSKAYSRSLTATNKLFAQNPLTKKNKSKKKKIFDPNSKYYQTGGINSPVQLTPYYSFNQSQSPEAWQADIKNLERQLDNPVQWTMDDYTLMQNKLNDYKAWRETTPEGQAVIDYHNEPNEYVVPLPYHLRKKQKGGFHTDINKRRQVLRDWVYGADIGMLQENDGGYFDTELTDDEIQAYRDGGYYVEELD